MRRASIASTDATIEIMARAGCTGINFGVESTDPEIQQGVHRKPISKPRSSSSKVAICRSNGIATFAFFVVGLPGDTVETILKSIEFAVDDAGELDAVHRRHAVCGHPDARLGGAPGLHRARLLQDHQRP